MPAPDPNSIEAIDREILEVQAARDEIVERLRKLHDPRDALVHDEQAKAVLESLSADQRNALVRLAAIAAPPGLADAAKK